MSETTRRNVLAGAAGVGAAAVLAGCGGNTSDDGAGGSGGGNSGANTNAGGQAATTAGAQQSAQQGAQQGGGATLAKKNDIPVGGGKVLAAQGVVVTQPAAGEFKAFGTRCPHAGCNVNVVANGTINCPCHGSKFSVADGSVKHGPAQTGLTPRNVTVQGDTIMLA